jgi:hypothetical protein
MGLLWANMWNILHSPILKHTLLSSIPPLLLKDSLLLFLLLNLGQSLLFADFFLIQWIILKESIVDFEGELNLATLTWLWVYRDVTTKLMDNMLANV